MEAPALEGGVAPIGAILEVDLLGQFRVTTRGKPVDGLRNPRLLAYVVLNRDRNLTRDEVAFALWPDSGDAQALTNLRRELHAIRHALPYADRYLALDHRTLRWRTDTPFRLDVAEFESAVKEPAAGPDALRAATELYRGDLLPGIDDEWLEPHRERLRGSFIDALARLADQLEQRRDYREAMAIMRRLIAADALDERAYCGLIRLAAASGDRSAGLQAYHACAAVLNDELGVAPSRETQDAYETLLAGHGDEQRPARGTEAPPEHRLVGRAEPWAALVTAANEARAGEATMVLLTGEPGIGKSRLCEELVRWARTQGIAAALASCYAAEGGLAYAPPARWLRTEPFLRGLRQLDVTWLTEVARLLPELVAEIPNLPAPAPMTEGWQRPRLFEAITRAIRLSSPAVLVLDDANWSDDDTLAWVHYLLRAEPSAPVLVVLSVRTEDLANPRIHSLTLDMRERRGLREIELDSLSEAEAVELAESAAERPLDPAERSTLFEESEGHPLLVVELARSGLSVDASEFRRTSPLPEPLRSGGPGHLLPARMRAVIATRLERLTPDARRLLELAAAFGRDFAVDALAAASDLDEPGVVAALDELWRRRLVRERGFGTYDVSHDRIRDVAYSETPPGRRRILHRRIAQSLELLHKIDLDPVAGQIAAHLEAAGQPRRAAELYERAADVAGRVSAFAEVLRSLDRALALLPLEPPSRARDERELELLFRRAPALNAAEGYSSPRPEAAFIRARELAETLDRARDASTAIDGALGVALVGGRLHEAIELGELGVASVSHPDDQSAAYFLLGGTKCSRGELEGAISAFQAARTLYRPGHSRATMPAGVDPGAIGASVWGAHALWLTGRTDEALAWSAESIRRADERRHPYSMTIARSYAAMLSQLRADIPAVMEHAAAAAELCARYDVAYYAEWSAILRAWADSEIADDSAHRIEQAVNRMTELRAFLRRPYYLWLLADVHRVAGRRDAALATLAEALAVANRNGEHWWTAEIHRLTGELITIPEDADAHFERALVTARTQASHALALRAGISIARRHPDRRKLLASLLAATPDPNEPELAEAAGLLKPARVTN